MILRRQMFGNLIHFGNAKINWTQGSFDLTRLNWLLLSYVNKKKIKSVKYEVYYNNLQIIQELYQEHQRY